MRSFMIAVLLTFTFVHASINEAGRGILFGSNHAFAITATTGWVLDNESAVNQGLHMVFYPKNETWSDSPVIIYGSARSTQDAASVKQQVEETVSDFRSSGHPNYAAFVQSPITLPNAQKGELYYYTGDQWGNYEAAVYFQELDTINFLVFNARTKEAFEKYLGDFLAIAATYKNLYISPTTLTEEKYHSLKHESKSLLTKPNGKEYESKAAQAIGQTMANAMQDCTAYLQDEELPAFEYFVRINKDGKIKDATVFPTNALSACFSSLMSDVIYPPHNFDSFVLDIQMKTTE